MGAALRLSTPLIVFHTSSWSFLLDTGAPTLHPSLLPSDLPLCFFHKPTYLHFFLRALEQPIHLKSHQISEQTPSSHPEPWGGQNHSCCSENGDFPALHLSCWLSWLCAQWATAAIPLTWNVSTLKHCKALRVCCSSPFGLKHRL